MALPFDIGDIYSALELAYNIIDVCWGSTHDARQQYVEFKKDIESLAENLNCLHLAISISRASTGSLLAPRRTSQTPSPLSQVFGDFKETLQDCQRLLDRVSSYGVRQGPGQNLRWFLRVEDEVNMLRDRIAFLNVKLSIALKSLEVETSNGTRILMREYTDLILHRIELAESRIIQLLGEPAATEPPPRLDIPQPLRDLFSTIAESRYGALTNITIAEGVDEAIFYLDQATQRDTRRPSAQQCHAFKMANILRAYWILQTTRGGDEYRAASNTVSVEEFERRFPRLGMTTRRFFGRLEEIILEEQTKLSRQQAGTVSVARLRAVIEQDGDAWQAHRRWKPQEGEEDQFRRGERVAFCHLQARNGTAEQLLEVYKHGESQTHLTLITSGTARDWIQQIDLKSLHLAPSMDAVSPKNELYSLYLSPTRSSNPSGFQLAFHRKGSLFEFQQLMTGYRVVDNFPSTTVTSQRAKRLIGGARRSDTCRVQLWSSTAPVRGTALPREFLNKAMGYTSIVSPNPPLISPLPSFSRLSLSLSPTRSLSSRSATPDSRATQWRQSAISSALTRISTATSFTSRSSSSSQSTTTTQSNMMLVDKQGNVGCVLGLPDPPRMVVFVPGTEGELDSQPQSSKPEEPRYPSLLVIDINKHIHINPSLCDCASTAQDSDNQPTLPTRSSRPTPVLSPPRQPQQQPSSKNKPCRRVILQCIKGSSIRARETASTTGSGSINWNLAGAGRYQSGEGLEKVKRLKMVTVEFGSVDERIRFVKYFEDLRELHLKDLKG